MEAFGKLVNDRGSLLQWNIEHFSSYIDHNELQGSYSSLLYLSDNGR